MIRNLKVLLITLIVTHSQNILAEPDKSVQYLMNDPMTMLDWGLYKMHNQLKLISFDDIQLLKDPLSSVNYDWDSNRLKIQVFLHPKSAFLQKVKAKKVCRGALFKTKERFGYGYEYDFRSLIGIVTFFEHTDFQRKSQPTSLQADLENITVVTVSISSSKDDDIPFSVVSKCTSKLLDKEIYFVDD